MWGWWASLECDSTTTVFHHRDDDGVKSCVHNTVYTLFRVTVGLDSRRCCPSVISCLTSELGFVQKMAERFNISQVRANRVLIRKTSFIWSFQGPAGGWIPITLWLSLKYLLTNNESRLWRFRRMKKLPGEDFKRLKKVVKGFVVIVLCETHDQIANKM